MRLIIFGPPGAGKGTQAELISKHFCIPHISTGEIFRTAIYHETPLGLEAKKYLDSGNLVPDTITTGIIRDALNSPRSDPGFLLDGFPRTLPQAVSLDQIIAELAHSIDRVINLVVEEEEIIDRMMKRGRTDDLRETIANRMKVYLKSTEPLIEFYRKKKILLDIDGMGEISEISERIFTALDHK